MFDPYIERRKKTRQFKSASEMLLISHINPVAPRKAKFAYTIRLSECNRANEILKITFTNIVRRF